MILACMQMERSSPGYWQASQSALQEYDSIIGKSLAYGFLGRDSNFDWSIRRVFTTIPNAVAEPDNAETRRWQLTQSLTVCPTLAATASDSPDSTAASISPQVHSERTPTAFNALRHCAV